MIEQTICGLKTDCEERRTILGGTQARGVIFKNMLIILITNRKLNFFSGP
jgi:hypothetical protein